MNPEATLPTPDALRAALADTDPQDAPSAWLKVLVRRRLDRLPLPGGGSTLQRWQALATVAEHDLSLAKLYESGYLINARVWSGTIKRGLPPKNSSARTWAPIQSAVLWRSVAQAKV